MQFAGQRTTLDLKLIGEPHNHLVKLSEDVLPDADALLVTGITPQQTISEGLTEVEFLKLFTEEISTPGTIFVGYNSIRFDDEFMRYLHYRNYYDPYEWQWQDGRSKWDLLDVVRMTRALRPDGIQWPVDSTGVASNRLELLTGVNDIKHVGAHDALADVNAVIDLARLIRAKQPKLFDFLLSIRDKKQVALLAGGDQPFVYTSGRYSSEFDKTTVVGALAEYPAKQGLLVFDLRYNPADFTKLTPAEIAQAMTRRWDDDGLKMPIKTLKYNKCPAIAPLSVLDKSSLARLKLDPKQIQEHHQAMQSSQLAGAVLEAMKMVEKQNQARFIEDELDVDNRLYEGFFADTDKGQMQELRSASKDQLVEMSPSFEDQRLTALWPLYKARNFPTTLSDEQRQTWESFCHRKLLGGKNASRAAKFFGRLGELEQTKLSDKQRYVLTELRLYAESILPLDD